MRVRLPPLAPFNYLIIMAKPKPKYVAVSEEETERIQTALKEKGVSFGDTFEIEGFERECVLFMKEILGLDYYDCLITDESMLSDFFGCGDYDLPEEYEREEWEAKVKEKIYLRFGIRVVRNVTLLLLCQMIRKTARLVGSGLN